MNKQTNVNFGLSYDDEEESISQLDGNSSLPDKEICHELKCHYSINCELPNVLQLLCFFRSFDCLWDGLERHKLCKSSSKEKECFFCHIRSSCIRINFFRNKGPKSLKLIEFYSVLHQYQDIVGWSHNSDSNDIQKFVEYTLKIIEMYEPNMRPMFQIQDDCCLICSQPRCLDCPFIYKLDLSEFSDYEVLNMKLLSERVRAKLRVEEFFSTIWFLRLKTRY